MVLVHAMWLFQRDLIMSILIVLSWQKKQVLMVKG